MKQKSGLIAAALFFFQAGSLTAIRPALSFHIGGTGSCESCHVMHNAKDKDALAGKKSKSLLLATDPSSVCLNCHAGPGGDNNSSVFSSDGSAMTPGGDFYWLTRTFTWADGSSPGDRHGHNVIALDFDLTRDSRLVQSPGGSYSSAALSCTSCHDPHGGARGGTQGGAPSISVSGSYGEQPASNTIRGNYRLLGDADYNGGEAADGFRFNYDAPVARQNVNIRFGESDTSHVDYGAGMSEWCANCHEGILRNNHTGAGDFSHPVDSGATLGGDLSTMYNTYINTGELLALGTGTGNSNTAYLQFVPFERGIINPEQLDPTSRKGTNTSSRVMCLTCHRAHASAFKSSGRWDFDAVLLAESHPRSGDGGQSGNDVNHSYYGRNIPVEFGPEQGPFCEKCHGVSPEPLPEFVPGQMFEPVFDPLPPNPGLPRLPGSDPLLQNRVKP
ncbi:MAG: hypothetical protein OEM01_02535 [Desulfobulbaceae bacterium]|nr:hypothetical protein [Desulfobulbaceae bacterium]